MDITTFPCNMLQTCSATTIQVTQQNVDVANGNIGIKHSPTTLVINDQKQQQPTCINIVESASNDDAAGGISLVSIVDSTEADKRNSALHQQHILKIKIPSKESSLIDYERKVSIVNINNPNQDSLCNEKIMQNLFEEHIYENLSDDQKLVLNGSDETNVNNKMSQIIESDEQCTSNCEDHVDSGTCSPSCPSPQPPPLPPKKKIIQQIDNHNQDGICSDDSASSLSSSDSTNFSSNHKSAMIGIESQLLSPELIRSIENNHKISKNEKFTILPSSLLTDIRNHTLKFNSIDDEEDDDEVDHHQLSDDSDDYGELVLLNHVNDDPEHTKLVQSESNIYENDKFYKFHINGRLAEALEACRLKNDVDESFAGLKDLQSGTSTIRSSKGTIRGVKNRVRNGIATFLQMQETKIKNYKDKDDGKIVVYSTSMGVVRSTYAKCQTVKQILRTLMVKFEERDVFMSNFHQQDIRSRMQKEEIDVPQVFVDGQYIGNADIVERLNESGELRRMLMRFVSFDSARTCTVCGGFKLLPCSSCGGSKKSIHRNHFTAEFIALKCMNCDEVGLVKCYNCCS